MGELQIRTYGDPVLRQATRDVEEIDGRVAALAATMIETMRAAPGVGLAANPVGVSRRVFVYDAGDGPATVINPRLVEADGEFTYLEGCLSVPGYAWEITRPNRVHLVGLDLDGHELSLEAEAYEGRIFQHELDHLDGVLLVERLDPDQRKEARAMLRAEFSARHRDPDGLASLLEL
ncbi:MAG TPA: peptide deformylase [Acidimicrobiales bacterium]|nr:peptide deformylase [Acidimicrobiales bacterium]